MGKSRIPQGIPAFNSYISTTTAYLPATPEGGTQPNYKRLGISDDALEIWKTKGKYWSDTLYPAYSNTDTRTKAITKEVENFRIDFKDFANPQLNIMAASLNANTHDEEVFKFVIKPKKPTHQHTPITELCNGTYQTLGGGMMKVGYRTSTDAKRPSLAKGANCVQLAYKIGDIPPKDVMDGTQLAIIPRASYTHSIGTGNSGKRLYVYQRWYNSKYPELAGPWSDLQSILIL